MDEDVLIKNGYRLAVLTFSDHKRRGYVKQLAGLIFFAPTNEVEDRLISVYKHHSLGFCCKFEAIGLNGGVIRAEGYLAQKMFKQSSMFTEDEITAMYTDQ